MSAGVPHTGGGGRPAREHYDVAIVGARCAGATLATLLARAGLKVVVVEQTTFPRGTLSSHVKQADALAFLQRLGVLERIRATGAPFTERVDARLDDFHVIADIPKHPGDVGGGACIRRVVLDQILADTAAESGAELLMGTQAVDLVKAAGRVAGLRVARGGSESVLGARLVIGADGRNSTVAKLCGARRYNVVPNQRAYYWSYFEGARISSTPTFVFHRWGDRFVVANPADAGLYMVGVSPEASERDSFRGDLEAHFMDHALSCEPVAEVLQGARRAAKIFGIVRFEGYFREPSGPGWALVGDAGHFKDPAAGRGIGDAFGQVDRLAPAILAGLGANSQRTLDRELARWGRWRDREFAEHYWQGNDFGTAGPIPRVTGDLVRGVCARGNTDHFLEMLSHRRRPSRVLTPPRMLTTTVGRSLRRPAESRELLRQLGVQAGLEARRRFINRYPVFVEQPAQSRGSADTQ
jgi:2-polyprenyl-6-methoxyphenol hydroxylase-like FAD-dependent oxidoreductase